MIRVIVSNVLRTQLKSPIHILHPTFEADFMLMPCHIVKRFDLFSQLKVALTPTICLPAVRLAFLRSWCAVQKADVKRRATQENKK